MMKRSLAVAAALMAMTSSSDGGVAAFAPSHTATPTATTTRLHLLPAQGKQLEAAMEAAYARAEVHQHSVDGIESTSAAPPAATIVTSDRPPLSQSARAFAARVFSLPSHIIRGHPHPTLEGLTASNALSSFDWQVASPDDDVVLFPLVGFQFVKDSDSHRVLPSKGHAACRLRAQQEEAVVGWFSKACHLDLYDDDHYCEKPSTTDTNKK